MITTYGLDKKENLKLIYYKVFLKIFKVGFLLKTVFDILYLIRNELSFLVFLIIHHQSFQLQESLQRC